MHASGLAARGGLCLRARPGSSSRRQQQHHQSTCILFQHHAQLAASSSDCSTRTTSSSPSLSPCGRFLLRPMQAADLSALKRLHKFCKYNGRPVFGTDMAPVDEMLEHAAAGADGAMGLVACSPTDSSDVLGGVTAQLEDMDGNPLVQQDGSVETTLVVLSVVVRADQRQQGTGRILLEALHTLAASMQVKHLATDIAAANQPAIAFFRQLGYSTKQTSGKTLEFALNL